MATPASAELIHARIDSKLVSFDSGAPTNLLTATQPTSMPGLIDSLPGDPGIFGLSGGTVRRYNETTGQHEQFIFGPNVATLVGTRFGFDINPLNKRVRVTSDLNQNLYLDFYGLTPQTNLPNLAYAGGDLNQGKDPNVVFLAYTNNVVAPVSTQLYGIDSALDALVTIDENSGTLHTVGPLGIDVIATGGFDISSATGVAFAALQRSTSSQSELFTINLATGTALTLGPIGAGVVVDGITVDMPIPEPSTVAMLAFALVASMGMRRRG